MWNITHTRIYTYVVGALITATLQFFLLFCTCPILTSNIWLIKPTMAFNSNNLCAWWTVIWMTRLWTLMNTPIHWEISARICANFTVISSLKHILYCVTYVGRICFKNNIIYFKQKLSLQTHRFQQINSTTL